MAKICFIAGLTFWLGNATVLGLGITYEPLAASAIDRLPAWFNRGLGIIALTVLCAYVVWFWRKPRINVVEMHGLITPRPGTVSMGTMAPLLDRAFRSARGQAGSFRWHWSGTGQSVASSRSTTSSPS